METSIKKSVSNKFVSVWKGLILLVLSIITSGYQLIAQAANDPSVKNLKQTGAALTEEVKRIRERQAHDEFMSYVYMVIGFSIVIAIAWISTVKAKKRSQLANEEKMKIIQQNLAHKKHVHGNIHDPAFHRTRR